MVELTEVSSLDESIARVGLSGEAALGVLRTLLEATTEPVCSLDRDNFYTSFNSAHAELMEALYDAEIELGHTLFAYQTVAEDREWARVNLERALLGEQVVARGHFGHGSGHRRYLEIDHRPIMEDGVVSGVVVTSRDAVATRAEPEADGLRERAPFEESLDAIAVVDLDGTLAYVTPAFAGYWGYRDAIELVGRPIVEMFQSRETAAAVAIATLETGSWTGELSAVRNEGSTFIVQLHSRLVTDEDGTSIGALYGFVDLTPYRESTQTLHDARDLLGMRQRAAGVALWAWDLDTGKLTWSAKMSELIGLEDGMEASIETWRDALHPDDRDAMETRLRESLVSGVMQGQYRRLLPPGEKQSWVEILGDLTRDSDGRPLRLTGVCVDVTQRMYAAEALAASEIHFRGFFEWAGIGMATTSPEKGWIAVNEALCTMLGYSPKELTQLTWSELTHPDDLASDIAQFERLTRGEIEGYGLDKRFIRKDGSAIHTHLVVHAVRESGLPGFDYLAVMLEDISDRALTEEALRLRNAELEQRVEALAFQLEKASRALSAYSC